MSKCDLERLQKQILHNVARFYVFFHSLHHSENLYDESEVLLQLFS